MFRLVKIMQGYSLDDVKAAYIERFYHEKDRQDKIIIKLEESFIDVTADVEAKNMEQFVGKHIFQAYGKWWAEKEVTLDTGIDNEQIVMSVDEYKRLTTKEDISKSAMLTCPICSGTMLITGICPKCEEYKLGFRTKIICDCGFEAISRSKIK